MDNCSNESNETEGKVAVCGVYGTIGINGYGIMRGKMKYSRVHKLLTCGMNGIVLKAVIIT
jgi:hypothetical protein